MFLSLFITLLYGKYNQCNQRNYIMLQREIQYIVMKNQVIVKKMIELDVFP